MRFTMKKTIENNTGRWLNWVIVFSFMLAACKQHQNEAIPLMDNFCLNGPLKTTTTFHNVEIQPVVKGLSLTGNVEFNPDKVIHFISLVGGVITNTYFSLGDFVERNQLLGEIKSTELTGLQSQRKTIESQLMVANRQLESVQSMHQDGIASQVNLLEAQSKVNVLNAELEKVKSNLSLFRASNNYGGFRIMAPSSGFIVNKNITPGMQISAEGDPLFTISDLSEVWITMNVYAGDVTLVNENMEVAIKTLAYPNEIFTGKISALSQVFDSEERVLKARVVLPNVDLKLKPGMLVDIKVKKDGGIEAPVVPEKALIFDDNRNFLLVYNSDCDIEIRELKILTRDNGVAFIGEGLNAGENVITRNQLLVYERLKNHL
jgi:membrane fusion protein, heavy metal efflux system